MDLLPQPSPGHPYQLLSAFKWVSVMWGKMRMVGCCLWTFPQGECKRIQLARDIIDVLKFALVVWLVVIVWFCQIVAWDFLTVCPSPWNG